MQYVIKSYADFSYQKYESSSGYGVHVM